MTFLFSFPTPKTILMIFSGKGFAGVEHCTFRTHCASHRLATQARLWAFGDRREEDFGQSTTRGNIHPRIIGLLTP
jgi:hypothetical protein